MKELSIEEKAKRYDEAIKRVEDIVGGKCPKPFVFTEGLFDYIFPELKESEDERIMACIGMCLTDIDEQRFADFNTTLKECHAWLEKQGTSYTKRDVDDAYLKGVTDTKNEIEKQYEANYQIRKDIGTFIFNYRGDIKDRAKWMDYLGIKVSFVEKQGEQKETLCDKCKKTQPSHSCQDITALGRCALEKQGEQKLTEFEKAVKQVMEEAIECGDTRNLKADAEMLLSLEHNSSWSEEDEKLLDKVIKRLHKYSAEDEEYLDKYYWLIELKHRVQPQNTWKPSDEQIKVLVEVLIFAANNESPHWNDYIFGILKNLTRQLKKLMEE